ncbi:hypothetical protein BHE74_00021723 [Ensete ventricosum]|nr:hypothetical protein BHE74_00021723 [Ensete ventricosum]
MLHYVRVTINAEVGRLVFGVWSAVTLSADFVRLDTNPRSKRPIDISGNPRRWKLTYEAESLSALEQTDEPHRTPPYKSLPPAIEEAMEEEAASRELKEHENGGGEAAKAVKIISAVLDAEDVAEMEEAAVAEVMKWLEEEMGSAAVAQSPSTPSYSEETSFVTINGNEESCGPSFSSSASTVMASIDISGGRCGVPYFVGCPSGSAPWASAAPLGRVLAEPSPAAPMAGPSVEPRSS